MLTASAGPRIRLPSVWRNAAFLVAVVALIGVGSVTDRVYAVKPVLAMAMIFFQIATGTSLCGLLLTRTAHRLGHISYGIYLLHGVVIEVVFATFKPLMAMHPAFDLGAQGLVANLTVLVALTAH